MDSVIVMQILALCFLFFAQVLGEGEPKCSYPKDVGPEHIAMQRLGDVMGRTFETQDFKDDGYVYKIGICAQADPENTPHTDDWSNVGVIQREKQNPDKMVAVGRFNETEVMGGKNWILLVYSGGKHYNTHCNHEQRRAHIMFTCSEGETRGVVRVLEENNNKTNDCYYLFEIEHMVACPLVRPSSLSLGSVIIIVAMVVVGVYLIGGFIYQRFVAGAKGLEQIPNFGFWRDFGNLQADGCNLICRCGYLPYNESREYRGMGDEQLPPADDDDDDLRDDHLLPM